MSERPFAPIMENEHVKELLSILQENGRDASVLTAVLGYVSSMERQLNKAADELQAMRRDLNSMREERSHPLRRVIQNAAKTLESGINTARLRLEELKSKIIDGCKNAVAAFRQKGISALNGIARFFRIKPALQSLRNTLQSEIKKDQSIIARIETISAEYHRAGRHLKNFGRALRGKEPIPDIKPNGRLAKLAEAPFRSELNSLTYALKDVERAIAAMERLERAAPQKTAEKERGEDKPSVVETIKKLQEKVDQGKKEAPVTEKFRNKGAEL